MIGPAVVLAALALQHPVPPSPTAARLAAFDSTKAAIAHIGWPVAEVRSALDVYRRAVFNGPDDDVLHNADYLRTSCAAVDSVARVMQPKICLHCAKGNVQAAFDGFRQMMPVLRRGMAQCSGRIWRLERGEKAAKHLRDDVRVVGNQVILTLRYYEARLGVVRQRLNMVPAAPPPATRAPRPGGAGS